MLAGLVSAPFLLTPCVIGADGTQDGKPPVAKPAEPDDAAKPTADAPGAAELGLLRNAADPSSAIEAYTRALAVAPKDVVVKAAFVRRMVDFGLPEMADTQALDVVAKDQGNGLAWGVLAYMNAKRGRTSDALSDVVLATNRDVRDPFILRTAGQLLAWYDTRADKAQVPDDVKTSVETMRAAIEKRPACADAYRRAHDAYAAAKDDADGAPSGPASPPQGGPAPNLVQPAEPGAAAEPPAGEPPHDPTQLVRRYDDPPTETVVVREPEIQYVYDTTYVYTDPYAYACRPAAVYCDPWWPTTSWCGGWYGGWYGGCGSGWGASVIVGGCNSWGIGFTWWGGGWGWGWGDCDDDHHDHWDDHHDNHHDSHSSTAHSGDAGKSAGHGRSGGANGARGGAGAASNNGADAVASSATGARRGGARSTGSGRHAGAGDGVARSDGSQFASRPGARATTAPRAPRTARTSGASASDRTAAAHSGDGYTSASRASFPQSRGAAARSYGASGAGFSSRSYAPSQHSATGASMRSAPSGSRSYASPSRGSFGSSGGGVRSSGGGVRSFGGGGGSRGGGHAGAGARGR
jgi:hypothetical protein